MPGRYGAVVETTTDPPQVKRRVLVWSWRNVGLGAVYVAPAAVATVADPGIGLALAVGVLPAAALGLPGPRRRRALAVLVGGLASLGIVVGSLVSAIPVLAVVTVFVLSVLAAAATASPARRLAPLVLALSLPLVGVGLSEDSLQAGAGAAALIMIGSVYAWLVSLAWPESPARPRAPRTLPPRSVMLRYGVQIGAAGAAGAAFGYAIGADHPGWPCAAALLVSRPSLDVLHDRAVGRAVSVLLGALVACTVAATDPSAVVLAAVATLAIVGVAATVGSRWYVMPFFTTTIVLSMLVERGDRGAGHWFAERLGETLVGVAFALTASLIAQRTTRRPAAQGRLSG